MLPPHAKMSEMSPGVTAARGDDLEDLARTLGLLDRQSAERLVRVRDSFLSLDKWAIFAGAGLSMGAGLPGWEALTRALAARFGVDCPRNPADNQFPRILKACLERSDPPEAFWDAVAAQVCVGLPTDFHHLVLRLPFEAILTINFDCLLAQAHARLDGVDEPRVVATRIRS